MYEAESKNVHNEMHSLQTEYPNFIKLELAIVFFFQSAFNNLFLQ